MAILTNRQRSDQPLPARRHTEARIVAQWLLGADLEALRQEHRLVDLGPVIQGWLANLETRTLARAIVRELREADA